MVRALTLFALGFLAAPAGASAATDAIWTETTPGFKRGPQLIAPNPSQSATFTLRASALRPRLAAAPGERSRAARGTLPTVSVPLPDGSLQRFRVVESPVMEAGLAAKVPEFTSYAAIGIDDPTATARLDLSPLGFHATVRSASGSWFVDPAEVLAPERHIAYRGTRREGAGLREPIESAAAAEPVPAARPAPGALVSRREYRLALASDPTYADEFPGAVDEAKATLVNRANQLYNDDVAIKMILVDGNEQLNFDTPPAFALAGYVTAMCTAATLETNQIAIDTKVGSENYDIGHLISASGAGGIAGLGVVGRDGVKAEGCTALPNPRGDAFAIDYFAHEVGHQFDANHTFNGSDGSCSGLNRNAGTSVESGSGSSIMAYAGICDTDDVQGGSDPWFSQRSIVEIQAYVGSSIDGAQNGGTLVATGNRAPRERAARANDSAPDPVHVER